MGAHATLVPVNPALLVPVPEGLDDATAATLLLDAVTAQAALDALGADVTSVLVQGVGGAVGRLTAQLAALRGLTVFGTASERTRTEGEQLDATVLDYRDPDWIGDLCRRTSGGVDGLVDHTGSTAIRAAVRPHGRIVSIAFGGAPGHRRTATAVGAIRANTRRFARPAERVCSVPLLVATRRATYRRLLGGVLELAASGELTPPAPLSVPFTDYAAALDAARTAAPGTKVVLLVNS
ncbi:zinc-binding dehydrogenase [Saccharopolyspora shandongensis]|uniref:zinc-binding dehydrogenase n=1 Tax=Saccharopolyspora shandongensis TaxID=418495 RepID=UPI0033C1E9CD